MMKLWGRCIVQESGLSLNLGFIALCNFVWIAIICHLELIIPFNRICQVAPHSQLAVAVTAAGNDSGAATCGVRLQRVACGYIVGENQRRLSIIGHNYAMDDSHLKKYILRKT